MITKTVEGLTRFRADIGKKVCCVALAGELITLSVISMDKPEINLPPNYYEPHEAPSNYIVPQWPNKIVAASTATSGTVNSLGYNVF